MLVDKTQERFICKDYDESSPSGRMFGLMEAQANGIMPSVLLNGEFIKNKYESMIQQLSLKEEYKNAHMVDIVEKVCKDISYEQHVSKRLLKKRLISLGHKELINFMNENQVDDFIPAIANRELDVNYTRCINRQQLGILIEKNKSLRSALESEMFVYANGYIVLNDERYVYASGGDYCLTEKAKSNIDEATLLFKVKKTYSGSGHQYNMFMLDRHATSGISTVSIPSSFEESLPLMVEKMCNKEMQKKFFLAYEVPDDDDHFSTYLINLMDKYNLSINDLVKISYLSQSTIKKYRRFNNDDFSLEAVLSICGAMKCKPYESKKLLKKAGFDITANNTKNDVINHLISEYDKGLTCWDDYYYSKLDKRLKKK